MKPACIHFYQLLFLVFYFSSETLVFTYQTLLLTFQKTGISTRLRTNYEEFCIFAALFVKSLFLCDITSRHSAVCSCFFGQFICQEMSAEDYVLTSSTFQQNGKFCRFV